jgi:hypothetical protein
MHILRKIGLFFAVSLFSTGLLATALFAVVRFNLLNPPTIKGIVRDNMANLHSTIDSVTKGAPKEESGEGVDLSDPAVSSIIKTTFTADFLQSTTDVIIDSVVSWLEGKTERPQFSIDLGPKKTEFINNISVYVRDRYTTLPVCTTMPQEADLLASDCQVPGISADQAAAQVVQELSTSEEFLPDTTLTQDDIQAFSNAKDLQTLRQAYQFTKNLFWLSLGSAVIGGLGVLLLSDTKRLGLKRIAKMLLASGLMILVSTALGIIVARTLVDKIPGSNEVERELIKNFFAPLVKDVQNILGRTFFICAGLYLLLAAALFVYLWRTKEPKDTAALLAETKKESGKPKGQKPDSDTEASK